jgi:hypothetical protein
MGQSTWHPKWWTEEKHGSAWSRIKEAMRRDWEQTKNDLHMGGRDLDQDVDDTVMQAAGKEPIPPRAQPNAPEPARLDRDRSYDRSYENNRDIQWEDVEEPMAYGAGARAQYGSQYTSWDDRLEGTLRREWEERRAASTGQSGYRDWREVSPYVRRGYERS